MNTAPGLHQRAGGHARLHGTPARGLTIVELLVSITLGLILIAAIAYLYVHARGGFRANSTVAHIQEAGRFGLDAILRDARRAGDVGCGSRLSLATGQAMVVNNLPPLNLPGDVNSPPLGIAFQGPAAAVYGVSASSFQFTPAAATKFVLATNPGWIAGDVIQMIVPTSVSVPLVADAGLANLTLLDNSAGFRNGDYVLVSNCGDALIAQVNGAPQVGAGSTVVSLRIPAAVTGALAPFTFSRRSSVQRIDAVTYYVGQVQGRWPALYRYSATYGVSEEVIDHVENMAVSYAVGAAPAARPDPATGAGVAWPQVTSIRVSLQVMGDEFGVAQGQQVSLLPGAPIATPDTRLRQVFTGTAALRERV